MEISFIIHGRLRRRSKLQEQIEESCEELGIKPVVHWTEFPHHGTQIAKQEVSNNVHCIISIGGDGSLNDAVNGAMQAHLEHGIPLPLIGCLPRGSGNDFVRSIRSPQKLHDLITRAKNSSHKRIDVLELQCVPLDGTNSTRYAINMIDVGLGGMVVEQMSKYPMWMGGKLRYQLGIIQGLLRFKHRRINIRSNELDRELNMMNLVIANGKYFGGGLGIAPAAVQDDGKADLTLIGEVSIWDYIRHLGQIKKAQHIEHPEISYERTTHLEVDASRPLPIDMDGEFAGYTPLRVKVLAQKVPVVC